jgi:plasmid replication initiation protein
MSEIVAYKSNWLIEASYKLTLQEQRFIFACIGKVDPQKEIPKTIELTAAELYLRFPDIGKKNAEKELKKAVDRLWDNSITVKDPETTEKFRWIQRQVIYHKGEARVSITFSDVVVKYLTQLKNQFTKIVLKNISRLTSTHSIRVYEMLQQFIGTGHRMIMLEDFRTMLKVENKYARFRDLNKWLVKPAVDELNEKSDLSIKVQQIKKGKTVIGLHFYFSKKEK